MMIERRGAGAGGRSSGGSVGSQVAMEGEEESFAVEGRR